MNATNCLFKLLKEISVNIFIGLPSYIIKESDEPVNRLHAVNLKDLASGRVAVEGLSAISVPAGHNLERFRVAAGDVLVSARGTKFKAALAGPEVSGAIVSANLINIRPGKELYPVFLAAYLTSAEGEKQVLSRAKATTSGQLLLNVSDIEDIEIPLPPYEVQKKIGDLWQELRGQQRRYNEAAELCAQISSQLISDMICNPTKEGNYNEQ